jgi:hypothetical protein
MLKDELQLRPYNKTWHRNALAVQLDNRTPGSIERKHQNISAVLIEIGHPWIAGYKPLGNYQALLAEVIEERVRDDRELAAIVEVSISAPATVPVVSAILSRQDIVPDSSAFRYPPLAETVVTAGKIRTQTNYLEMEARNASLGNSGEIFVIEFERARLGSLGREDLANRIEHTAVIEGDGAGFDIRSFEHDASDRFIEVKTTGYGKQTPFFLSRNEVAVSKIRGSRYHLYRLFTFRDDPRFYALNGSMADQCILSPLVYAARPKVS